MVVGVMGFVCSGKSTISKYVYDFFIKKNIEVLYISTDDLAKEIINSEKSKNDINAIKEKYGDITFNNLVNNNKFRKEINNFVHPIVWDSINTIINIGKFKYKIIIIETALPSIKFLDMCDKTIYSYLDKEIILERLEKNRNLSNDLSNSLIEIQNEYLEFYNKADIKIDNHKDIISLERQVNEICESWQRE